VNAVKRGSRTNVPVQNATEIINVTSILNNNATGYNVVVNTCMANKDTFQQSKVHRSYLSAGHLCSP